MTMHKIIVISMLAVSTVSALFYVSGFPVEGASRLHGAPTLMLESERPSAVPANGSASPNKPMFDAEALRHLA